MFGAQALERVQVLASLGVGPGRLLQVGEGPNLDLEHLEGIEHRHGDGVGALIGEMAPDAGSQPFIGLADIDRLAVVVEEGVDAPAIVADERACARGIVEWRVEETGQVLPQVLGLKRWEVHRVGISTE